MDVLFLFLFKGIPTAWQSLKNVVTGAFTPLVKEVGRLLSPGETGACKSVQKWYNTCQSFNRPPNTPNLQAVQTILTTDIGMLVQQL